MPNLTYPVPTANDTVDLLEILRFTNNAVEGFLFPMVLLIIWTIAFIGSLAENKAGHRAFLFATFITLISSVLLSLLSLVNPTYMYFLVVLFALGLIWTRLTTAPS